MQTETIRQDIVGGYLRLMGENPFDQVSMAMVAEAAGISLSRLRATFASEEHLLEAFAEMIDCAMLDYMTAHPVAGGPRDRILAAMLARFGALRTYKPAIRSILIGASRDPETLLFFNRVSIEEHKWTLIAAGLDHRGARARNLAEAISQAFVSAAGVWLDDNDDTMPRTRASLDQAFGYQDTTLAAFETVTA